MLAKLFIKDYKNVEDTSVRNAYGVLASVVGVICNILLSTAKIVIGALFGAVAIVADGLNNLSDAGSSLVTMFGFRMANRPADNKHPFGHARVEYVSSMIISFIVLFLGLELAISGVEKMFGNETTTVTTSMMIVLAVSIAVKIGMFIYFRGMSKKINSDTLKATGIDSLNDAVASSAVLISMIVTFYTGYDLDGIMAIIVALFILVGGVKLFKETISPLLGEAPTKEFVDHICEKVRTYEGVLGLHDLIAHNYGYNKYYASLHIEVDASRDILDSHELIDKIERDFKTEGYEVVIHLDPIIVDDERVNSLKMLVHEKLAEIDNSITFHDFRVVWGTKRKNLIFDIVLPHEYKMTDSELVEELTYKIKEADPTCFLVVDVDRNYAMNV